MLARAPAVPVVHMVTHNDNDYADPGDRVCRNFVTVLREIGEACRRRGAEPVGATFADIVARVHESRDEDRGFVYAHASMLTG